jgi:hypothetical protein
MRHEDHDDDRPTRGSHARDLIDGTFNPIGAGYPRLRPVTAERSTACIVQRSMI